MPLPGHFGDDVINTVPGFLKQFLSINLFQVGCIVVFAAELQSVVGVTCRWMPMPLKILPDLLRVKTWMGC